VTAFFTLVGTGPDERLRPKTEAPKKKGRMPFEVESTTVQEPPPPPPKPAEPPKPKPAPVEAMAPAKPPGAKVPLPKRDEPRQQRLSQAFRAEKPKAPEPKAESPRSESPKAESPKAESPKPEPAKPAAAKPEAPKAPAAAAGGEAAKAGAAGGTPGTLSPMPASGYSGEEPTESGGWVLSGFDANGMAVRLNISDVDLRSADEGIVIGRNAKQCRLVLNDDSVSRRHARLSGSNPLTIEDLDSANGTVVNRQMLTPGEKMPIEPGVAIEIGAVRLTLVRS